ncbi:MAG: diaminopimelate decarboxylase [Clostridium sp.]
MKFFGSMEVVYNELYLGGISTIELSKEYGTPLYVIDEEEIRNKCRRYLSSFENNGRNRVAYAGKAFLPLAMCKLIEEEEMYLDIVSGGELFTAYKSGFPLDRIYFHGNNKTIGEIEMGVSLGVGTFVVDNFYEMELISKIAKEKAVDQRVILRITPGVEAHTHEYIKTGQIDSKFGFTMLNNNTIEAVKKAIELENVYLAGLHCHIGSQIFDIQPYEDAVEIMLNIIEKIKQDTGYIMEELDLGGGFGIYYKDGDTPKSIEEFSKAILDKANAVAESLHMKLPILTIEPGRSIVGNAGITLYTVGTIKDIPKVRKYVSVDGGMTDNIRPALYRAQYESVIANNIISDEVEEVTISGKCCESGDILLSDVKLSKVESGDILAIMSTGAYGYSMASNYNKIPRPPVIMVNKGESRVICKRESYQDIINNEFI